MNYETVSTSEERELTTEMSISVDISSLESEEESSTASTTTFRSLFLLDQFEDLVDDIDLFLLGKDIN